MRRHAMQLGAAGAVGALVAVALVVLVNWISSRHYISADWTSARVYSLSEKTRNILSDLDEEVGAVVFMTVGSPQYDQVKELLDRYAAATDRLTVEFINPDHEPLRTQELAREFGISAADTVVFTAGARSKYVTSDDLVEYDYSGMQMGQGPQVRAFKGEQAFTSAILSLVAPTVPKVYLVEGHGEAALDGGGPLPSRGLATLDELLRRENIEVEGLTLFGGEVPPDADVLAILGPNQEYTDLELEALADYLDRGGRLLVCLDPIITEDGSVAETGLEAFLADRGVRLRDDLVVDPQRGIQGYDAATLYLRDYGSHPVTQGLEGVATLFTVSRSVEAVEGAEATVTRLVETSDEGWGEAGLEALVSERVLERDPTDVAGPVAVAVAVELPAPLAPGMDAAPEGTAEPEAEQADEGATAADPELEPKARMVVVGDSDFLTDQIIGNLGNVTLTLNAVNWLGAREQALGIPPREIEQVNLFLDRTQMRTILLLVLLVLPGAAVAAGIVVWRRRRH